MMRAVVAFLALALVGLAHAAPERVVSLGGDLTEIAFALGKGDSIIAVDLTSVYPEEATKLPKVGYVRRLSAEGILAMKPDLILVSGDAGPPEVIEQLKASGVELVTLPKDHTLDGIRSKIETVAKALGAEEEGAKLAEKFDADRKAAEEAAGKGEEISAIYVMARGDGALVGAGTDTAADVVLRAAGLRNLLASHPGYKPVSGEALVVEDPQVIVTGTRSVEAAGGLEQFKQNPALAQTSAARNGRILVFDDMYLLGMGPRTAEAVEELSAAARN